MKPLNAFRSAAILMAVAILPATAVAQEFQPPVRRPYRALFGGDPRDGTDVQLTVSLSGAYDDNVWPRNNVPLDRAVPNAGHLGGASATFSARHVGEKKSGFLAVASSLRYYPDDGSFAAVSHGAFGRLHLTPRPRTSVQVNGGFVWAPMYSPLLSASGLGEGTSVSVPTSLRWAGDYIVADRPAIFSYTSLTLSQTFRRRTSIGGGYTFAYRDLTDEGRVTRNHTGTVEVNFGVSRYSRLRLAYAADLYTVEGPSSVRTLHNFTTGIDYSRPLSISGRRTTLMITPGWTILDRSGELQIRAGGSAGIRHNIGRTWTVGATYQRGHRYIESIPDVTFADALIASIEGSVAPRLQLTFMGQQTSGYDDRGRRNYEVVAGAARANFALVGNLSLFAQYVYLDYGIDAGLAVPDGVPRHVRRQGVRVGVTVWAPLLR